MNGTKDLRMALERKKGERQRIEADLSAATTEAQLARVEIKRYEMAQKIIVTVAQQTQEELVYHISDLGSMAMSAIFEENPYALDIEFVLRRGKTECDIWFNRDGQRLDPMTGSGGGAIDVASFALRIAMWTLTRPRSRNVIILDEPFRFLSKNLHHRGGLMLQEISKKLNLQIIMVTHSEELAEKADKTFYVFKKCETSLVQIKEITE